MPSANLTVTVRLRAAWLLRPLIWLMIGGALLEVAAARALNWLVARLVVVEDGR